MSRTIKNNSGEIIRTKAIAGHLKRCTAKDVHPNIKFVPDPENKSRWFFLIGVLVDAKNNEGEFSGDQDEFKNAQIFGEVTATSKYPFAPPEAKLYTPTGVFPLNNSDFCVDIGKYHKDQWPATYGMDGFAKMLLSGLIGWKDLGGGINLLTGGNREKKTEEIKQYSANSQDYNKANLQHIVKMFRA